MTAAAMLSNIVYRSPKNGEEPAILKMIQSVVAEYGLEYIQNPGEQDFENLQRAFSGSNERFYVLETPDGQLAGCAGLKCHAEGVAEICKMYFTPMIRGQGLGRQTMERLLDFARERGYRKVVMESNSRLIEAQKLYEKFGFRASHNPKAHLNRDLFYELDLLP
jgi:putative acetyltransferase